VYIFFFTCQYQSFPQRAHFAAENMRGMCDTSPMNDKLRAEKDLPRTSAGGGYKDGPRSGEGQARHSSTQRRLQSPEGAVPQLETQRTSTYTEDLVAAISAAIDPEKSKPKALSKEQEDGLYAYYCGKKPLPERAEHRARILHRIALYQRDVLQPRHLREYGSAIDEYFKTPDGKKHKEQLAEYDRAKRELQDKYRPEGRTRFDEELWPPAYFDELETLNQRLFNQDDGTLRQLVPLGLPYRPERTQADDLPEISPVLALILHENPEVLVEARRSFMLALSTGIGDENSPEGKFCRVLSLLLAQGHRMYAEAGDIAKLHQLENVSLVLLTYGIVRPAIKTLSNGRTVPSFSINPEALRQDVADFLTMERSSRSTDESGTEIQDSAVQIASARIEARAQRIGIKEPRTAIAAICGRLSLPIRSLPVFEEPQEEDAKKANARSGVGRRSLGAALHVLAERIEPEDTHSTYDPSGITERIATSSNIVARVHESAATYAQHIDTLDGALSDTDEGVQIIARALLRQISNDMDVLRTEMRNMRDLIKRGEDKAQANREYREKHGGEIIARAETLLTALSQLDIRLGKLIYASGSPERESTESEDVAALRARAEALQREVDFMKEEAADHVVALTAFQTKIQDLLEHMSKTGSRTDLAKEQVAIKMRLRKYLDALDGYLNTITSTDKD
jgi:hypothetical protein